MSRALLAAALILPGCIVIQSPGEPDRSPIRTECDRDADGVEAIACGGEDCDDDDASVAPDADEWFGDQVDQDCDGTTDVQVDTFPLPARTEAVQLTWSPDLRGIGGVIVSSTGDAVAQDFDLDPVFGGPVVLKRRSTYAPPSGELQAVRLPFDNGVVDLLADEDGLAAWRPGGSDGERLWTRSLAPGSHVDAAPTADDPSDAWLLSCNAAGVDLTRIAVADGAATVHAGLDRAASSCALLGHREGRPIVLLASDRGLERWILDEGGVLADYLLLTPSHGQANLRTVGARQDGVLAFVDEGKITVLDPDGRGLRLGDGAATEAFDVEVVRGEVVVSWVDTQGLAWIGTGPIEGPIDVYQVHDALLGAGPVVVGALDDELAVAIQDRGDLVLLRARR